MRAAPALALTQKCAHYTAAGQLPPALRKYFHQRHRLFSLYDDGIALTHDAWFGVTPEPVAARVAEDLRAHSPRATACVVDLFAGAGGNAIAFALAGHWARVVAVERDASTLACAQHNARVYGVPEGRITWVLGDSFEYLRRLRLGASRRGGDDALAEELLVDVERTVLFSSPPWGGPGYLDDAVFDLNRMEPYNLASLRGAYEGMAHALYLPRTSDVRQLARLASKGGMIDVVHYCTAGASKALVAYYSESDSEGSGGGGGGGGAGRMGRVGGSTDTSDTSDSSETSSSDSSDESEGERAEATQPAAKKRRVGDVDTQKSQVTVVSRPHPEAAAAVKAAAENETTAKNEATARKEMTARNETTAMNETAANDTTTAHNTTTASVKVATPRQPRPLATTRKKKGRAGFTLGSFLGLVSSGPESTSHTEPTTTEEARPAATLAAEGQPPTEAPMLGKRKRAADDVVGEEEEEQDGNHIGGQGASADGTRAESMSKSAKRNLRRRRMNAARGYDGPSQGGDVAAGGDDGAVDEAKRRLLGMFGV
jgi:trimethylguanosine synthase